MKKGFTLIELVMVIVILGIISMFGADLYSQIYKSYLHTRALNQLESRTQNAITLISNRLEYRIYGSVIGREAGKPITDFINLAGISKDHDIIEWIGQSIETKNINNSNPGWSGFVDMSSIPNPFNDADNKANSILSQGSSLNSVSNIIDKLTCVNRSNCATGRYNDFVIIFTYLANDYDGVNIDGAYGYNGTGNNSDRVYVASATVGNNDDENLTITNYPTRLDNVGATVREFSDQYYLAHSAYAIYPTGTQVVNYGGKAGKNFDLTLAYNYRPWAGETYSDATTQKVLLAEDVFMFRFRDDNGAVEMKLCMRDNGRNFDPNQLDMIMCKSQVVY
ncbi:MULTISPECIES: prepilin-type N-terminal cleavage/methylation domain-containing protein [unclassified Campylobacter]|uniref:prepilin-type N-terminal cleavage/methylation domain-containing protein n=1 Tax=unclassified Campylobacter TaxID=2593542 RepID=UPI0022E9C4D9|nr:MULTISPECIES: prepilin-type N-terminal cleavage/methylation domain-containing protein [unclassified Campylobacter]MDA3054260.1 prepilin-type N-terminal cleavage/methylation domain-containing protein [Campylobacter sp. VBCF_07 NA4]MDA3060951.1 prepilin-type N-terminal cleavage/methylation domain-containing protein [Campylobacter sp. VBCF_02 NA5]MDA3070464.1 prepilin-type N-terminal cleavage/methylation domain-containing protein [Campylobacter sp. VBCF_08 NA3]WBR53772.1 prepilin-type N-termina